MPQKVICSCHHYIMKEFNSTSTRFDGLRPHSCSYCAQVVIAGSTTNMAIKRKKRNRYAVARFSYAQVNRACYAECFLFQLGLELLENAKIWGRQLETKLLPFLSLKIEATPAINGQFESIELSWNKGNEDLEEHLGRQDLRVLDFEGNKPSHVKIPSPLNPDPGSSGTLELIRRWAQICWDEHPDCAQARAQGSAELSHRMPARLLAVGSIEDASILLCDIQSSPDINSQYKYAALSYCWGGKNFTLTRNTTDKLYDGIDLVNLPKTIQHAIYITRILGLSHIWIDALCIMQDDEEDKKQELPKMPAIYASAMVVISAAVAESCHQGFLHRRNICDLLERVYKLPYHSTTDKPQKGSFILSDVPVYDCGTDPIDKRGWTLQEHIQAVSLLRFGTTQVQWRCKTWECPMVDGGIRPPIRPMIQQTFDGSYDMRSSGDTASNKSTFNIGAWLSVLKNYTARSLSYPSDALPAFSIVAHNYSRTMRGKMGKYHAGLWDANLALQLLWYKEQPLVSKGVTRLKPSWSWASLPGGIKYMALLEFKVKSYVLDIVDCVSERPDQSWEYGSVISGALIVNTRLRRFRISLVNDKGYAYIPYSTSKANCFDQYTKWDTDFQYDPEHLFIMEIIPVEEEAGGHWSNSIGLVLRRLEDGNFERVGYYVWPIVTLDDAVDFKIMAPVITDNPSRTTIV